MLQAYLRLGQINESDVGLAFSTVRTRCEFMTMKRR